MFLFKKLLLLLLHQLVQYLVDMFIAQSFLFQHFCYQCSIICSIFLEYQTNKRQSIASGSTNINEIIGAYHFDILTNMVQIYWQ